MIPTTKVNLQRKICVVRPVAFIFTDRIRSTTESYVFTGVCLLEKGGGGTSRYLSPWPRYLPPRSDREDGGGVPQGTYPPDQGTYPPSLTRSGVGEGYPKVSTPPNKVPSPPPPDRTAYGVLDTPRSVCLLRSRRRTFLCIVNLTLLIYQQN